MENIGSNIVANLNSNFLGTQFNLTKDNKALAAITYEFNILGIKGPRKMRFIHQHLIIKVNIMNFQ